MHVVIDIDENVYTRLFDNGKTDALDVLKACRAVRKGVVLQKGHGRLIDADEALKGIDELKQSPWFNEDTALAKRIRLDAMEIVRYLCIIDAPTIIEADKEKEVRMNDRNCQNNRQTNSRISRCWDN